MRNLERRLQRMEELVNEDEGLTLEDVEFILSCLLTIAPTMLHYRYVRQCISFL